jgi:hypothetical protein
MATNDDLVALFARNLSLNPYVAPVEEPKPAPAPAPEPYIYSITQHYHHSAHVAAHQPSRPASEPPQTDQLTTEIILSRHGVDISTLSPAQIELFKSSAPEQQMHLIQLWLISPPEYGGHALVQDLPSTSLQQEQAIATMRMERNMQEEAMSRTGGDVPSMDMTEDTMSDASNNAPLTPIQGGDGRWTAATGWSTHAEPYMQSGYEILAQREYELSSTKQFSRATDPVYKTVADIYRYPHDGNDWDVLQHQKQQAMENQYGQFQQQFQHNSGGVTAGGYQGEDEEML